MVQFVREQERIKQAPHTTIAKMIKAVMDSSHASRWPVRRSNAVARRYVQKVADPCDGHTAL